VISRLADRAVNRTALAGPLPASDEARTLVRDSVVIDLVVGSALFRDSFVAGGRGHVDLPRLRRVGVNVVGLTIATRFPDLRGTLSAPFFRSQGMPRSALRTNMATAEWLLDRIERWVDAAGGELRVVRAASDLAACAAAGGPIGILLGVQGGHVLDGDLRNVARLRERGVRMLAPAHVMDNELVGAGTGTAASGLSALGREAIGELEAQGLVVDLAHMSLRGIDDALPLLKRRFVLSHTGLTELAGRRSRSRRYSPATRNVPAAVVRHVAAAGGLVGLVLSSELLGSSSLAAAARAFAFAVDVAGRGNAALGSDMDGALRMIVDVEGLPALAGALLDAGMPRSTVEGVLGATQPGCWRLRCRPERQARRRQRR
jgi:membrane dipeptidase